MPQKIHLEIAINEALASVHQTRDPLSRAQRAGEVIDLLQRGLEAVAALRRRAVAEAAQWPNMSLAKVADALGMSKAAVAKLVTPDIRDQIASDMRQRLAKGFNPPPLKR